MLWLWVGVLGEHPQGCQPLKEAECEKTTPQSQFDPPDYGHSSSLPFITVLAEFSAVGGQRYTGSWAPSATSSRVSNLWADAA